MNKTLIVLFFFLSIVYPQQMLSSEGTIFGTLNNNTETRIIISQKILPIESIILQSEIFERTSFFNFVKQHV